MGHDWIFDVLGDLRDYAIANGLPALASKADEALQTAMQEIAVKSAGPVPEPESGDTGTV